MRHSANINIMAKAIEKASFKTARDLSELEILQSNPDSAIKFANSCYLRTKENLAKDLTNMRPEYNILFSDGEEIINKESADYSFIIYPIDGLNNLSRSLGDCSIAIALQYTNENGEKNSIATVIYKIISNELYHAEKGFGAFLNNRKIRASKRKSQDSLMICSDNLANFSHPEIKNFATRNYGCKTLEIAYLASGKIDLCHFSQKNSQYLEPFFLLAQEAEAKISQTQDSFLLSNKNI